MTTIANDGDNGNDESTTTYSSTDSNTNDPNRHSADGTTTSAATTKDASSTTTTGSSSLELIRVVLFSTLYGAAFSICFFMLIVGFSVVDSMNFLFFEFLQGSYTTDAITVAVSVMFELPIFQLAPSLLRAHGVGTLLLVANVAYIVRILGYTFIPQGHVAYVFLLEPLHGVTYACSQTSMVEYVQSQMPLGAEASGQGIVNLIRGVASVLGMGLGGIAQDVFGPRTMYRIFVVTVTIGMSFFYSVTVLMKQDEDKKDTPDPNVNDASSSSSRKGAVTEPEDSDSNKKDVV